MPFVDTRLHVAVRPALEYRLPDAARATKRVLLGEGTPQDAVAALQACVADDDASPHPRPYDECEDEDEAELQRLCAAVCTHVHEHLQSVAAAWRTALQEVHASARRVTRQVGARVQEAHEVRARHRARAPALVDREHRLELARLRRELDDTLLALAQRDDPAADRPAALVDATESLKRAFAFAYGGTVPTKRLVALKTRFEHELAAVQRSVAVPFVREVTHLLQ